MRAPTVQESLLGGDHPGGATVDFYPNPFLNPELLKGWELGANIKANGLLVRDDSLCLKANSTIISTITGVCQGVSENIPTSNLQGVEFQSMFDAKVFAGLSYTYTHTNLPSQLNGLGAQSYTPEHMAGQGHCASSIRS